MPCAGKARFFVHIYCRESWIVRRSCTYTLVCGEHARIQDYNDHDCTHCKCATNYGFTHVNFVQNASHMRFFSSRVNEFLSQKISAKAKGLPFGKICNKGN